MPTFCHITPVLFDLYWLPVKFRIYYNIIITMFTGKCLHNIAPHYQSSLLSVQMNSEYGLRSNNQLLLSRPSLKRWLQLVIRHSLVPHLNCGIHYHWLNCIRQIDNFNLFKNKLKTFIFRQAFSDFKWLGLDFIIYILVLIPLLLIFGFNYHIIFYILYQIYNYLLGVYISCNNYTCC